MGQAYIRLCVPSENTHIVLTECHDDPMAGDLGINKTLEKFLTWLQNGFWLCKKKESDSTGSV